MGTTGDGVGGAARETFTVSPHLLWQVIHSQAGSLWKAILEGVMNSVDAGATGCSITLARDRVEIADDGRGFEDRDEVLRLFGTFGLPHREGDATYGKFRMGRGQLFSYGANEWSSNGLLMSVDLKPQEGEIETKGLGYSCVPTDEVVRGCRIRIRLYEPLLPSDVDALAAQVSKAVAWCKVPVRVNGRLRSRDPAGAEWDHETDDAYVKVNATNSISVYNLGVYVADESAYKYGAGGVVVSKRRLEVNFARNAVQGSCPVWRRVTRAFGDRTERRAKPRRMTDAERAHTIARFLAGGIDATSFLALPVLEAGNGSRVSPRQLARAMRGGLCATTARGDRRADALHQAGTVATLTEACVAMFDVETALEALGAVGRRCAGGGAEAAEFARLAAALRETTEEDLEALSPDGYEEVPSKDLRKGELAALEMLRCANRVIGFHFGRTADDSGVMSGPPVLAELAARTGATRSRPRPVRELCVGRSERADAWTDGRTHVTVERRLLSLVAEGRSGMTRLVGLLLHEHLHEGASTETHDHDEAFYKTFHDLALDTDVVGEAVDAMLERGKRMALADGRRLRGAFRRDADQKATTVDKGRLDLGRDAA